jgi:hypothetical protein
MASKKVPKSKELKRFSEEDWPLLELGDLRAHNLEIEAREKKMKKKPRRRK